jgi:hypothetical protein
MAKQIMKLNKEWHLRNIMPIDSAFEERVKWHLAHQKNYSCRPIPDKRLDEMKAKKLSLKKK